MPRERLYYAVGNGPPLTSEMQSVSNRDLQTRRQIDWTDVKFAIWLGVIAATVRLLELKFPSSHFSRTTTDIIASALTVGYILARARRQPEKMDGWGITTRLTLSALLAGLALLGLSVAMLAVAGILVAGKISFEPAFVPQMIEYLPAGFPQQFVLCSIGLTSLATLRPLRGPWRLPLAVGLAFSLAHFWTPARIPGTIVPVQMLITFPAGFVAAFYFLTFRNILPLTASHAVLYPLLHNWIESHL